VVLDQLERLDSLPAFAAWLQRPQAWIAGFGLSLRLAARTGRAPRLAPGVARLHGALRVAHAPQIRDTFAAFCDARPAGSKFAHRKFDRLAGSSPSMKWVNPPVAYMLHAACRCCWKPGCTSLACNRAIPQRVALEAYPGLLARELIGTRSYKNDDKARQDDRPPDRAQGPADPRSSRAARAWACAEAHARAARRAGRRRERRQPRCRALPGAGSLGRAARGARTTACRPTWTPLEGWIVSA
jgi:hypothetical protein